MVDVLSQRLDNSLILVSTLPLKDLSSSFKESTISSVVESRRAEMLLQANTLDERETFSPLRHLARQNAHYFYVTHHLQPARTPCHGGRLRSAD